MSMIFFPAIDLKDGHCVRLYKGEMAKATVFGTATRSIRSCAPQGAMVSRSNLPAMLSRAPEPICRNDEPVATKCRGSCLRRT